MTSRLLVLILAATLSAAGLRAQDAPPGGNDRPDLNARRQLDTARDLMAAREYERGIKIMENVLERFPNDPVRFQVYLILGKHHLEQKKYGEAVGWLTRLNALEKPEEPLHGENLELFLEGLYQTGAAYFEQRQYEKVFPVLRRITANYPHSNWANQAYYHIGMAHFAIGNWNKAIENLSLVGTVVDPNSPTLEYAEAGRRLYVKILDADLPILHRLGKEITATAETAGGDKEKIVCVPLSGKGDLFVGSVPTDVGVAKPSDGILQVVSGDTITVKYFDDNTQSGQKDVLRTATVKVVSTAAMSFTMGTFDSPASAAFQNQPLFISLFDADRDTTPQADSVTVKVRSRYKEEDKEGELTTEKKEEEKWKVRDEVTVTLTEQGTPPVRTGRFTGSVKIVPAEGGKAPDKTDQVLSCMVGDEIEGLYVDELNIGGRTPREVKCRITVSGEIENRPRAEQFVVTDPLIRAKKHSVEATAFLELARIFRSMGLVDGAKTKADEGLNLIEVVVRAQDPLPSMLRERAFELKWELELAKEDYAGALATCQAFSKLFPNSPLADQALLGMGKARMEGRQYRDAATVFQRILGLANSQAKAEAQFRIAECIEAEAMAALAAGTGGSGGASPLNAAVQAYKSCADRYPASEFAGPALAKVVDYHMRAKDFAQADDLLEQIFNDHPDAKFLDEMLLKWAIVAFRREDYAKAQQKLTALIYEYPESKLAEEARKFLPQVEAKLKK